MQPTVHPSVVVQPAGGLGVHRGETGSLLCNGSGFPRPEVTWTATENVRLCMNLLQQLSVVDEYTVFNYLRIEEAQQDMSGTYACSVCHYSQSTGSCEAVEPTTYVQVQVYGKRLQKH